jgi:hypothetical protein
MQGVELTAIAPGERRHYCADPTLGRTDRRSRARSKGEIGRLTASFCAAHLVGSAQTRLLVAQTSEPALLEGLAGLNWSVDRRDLAEREGQSLFHTPAPPDDQLALQLVLGERGRDQVER